ncbi:unnamed protein product [Boreogadus saida]
MLGDAGDSQSLRPVQAERRCRHLPLPPVMITRRAGSPGATGDASATPVICQKYDAGLSFVLKLYASHFHISIHWGCGSTVGLPRSHFLWIQVWLKKSSSLV